LKAVFLSLMEQTLYFLFFLSGASSLIFETIFTRLLTYTYGNTAYAVSTVLAAFLGGLALGAFLLGRWVDRHPPSLWIYGGRQSNPDSAPAKRPGSGGDVRLGTPLFDKHAVVPRRADRDGTNGDRCSRVFFYEQACWLSSPCLEWGQWGPCSKLGGSLLISRGGSLFTSAEGLRPPNAFTPLPGPFSWRNNE